MSDDTPGDVTVEDEDIDIPIDELDADENALEDAMGSTMESAGDAATPSPLPLDIPDEPPTIPGDPPDFSAGRDRASVELELGDDDIVVAEVASDTTPPRPPPSRKPPPKPASLAPKPGPDNGASPLPAPVITATSQPPSSPPRAPSSPPRPASIPPLTGSKAPSVIPSARAPSLGPLPPPPPAPPPSRPLSRPPAAASGSRGASEVPPAPRPPTVSAEATDDVSPKPPSLSDLAPISEPPRLAPVEDLLDEESFDGAKTAKFDRRRQPSMPDDDDAPPDIPYLGSMEDEDTGGGDASPRRKRTRKGKRSTVKIPDDSIPATPTPPAVAVGRAAADDAAPEHEDYPLDEPTEEMDEPAISPPTSPVEALAADAEELDPEALEPEDSVPELDGSTRKSAPGIFTDETAISVLRPIQVFNDLPAMPPTDDLEELEPESFPKPPIPPPPKGDADAHGSDDLAAGARRPPPPPPKPHDDDLDAIEEIEPDRMSLPVGEHIAEGSKRPPPPPPRSGEPHPIGVADLTGEQQAISLTDLSALEAAASAAHAESPLAAMEADAALAEARAKEAELRAKEAEAKARAAAAKAEAAARKSQAGKKRPWWSEIFEDDLIRTLDNPKKHDVEKEAAFIDKSLRLDKGSRILDLACGTGVHAVELSLRGYQVVGVDLSSTMLELAKQYNDKRGASVSFIQGDMRQLNLEGVFDGIYCWSASFGFFDEQHNGQVLERVARALRPGGMFTLDVCNRDFVAPRSPTMAWFEKGGCVCMDEMRFDFYSSRMITKRMVLFDNGRSREVEMSIRLYTLHELGRMLHKCGFRVLEVSGHTAHRGAYFGYESPRIIITSQRREPDESKKEQSS